MAGGGREVHFLDSQPGHASDPSKRKRQGSPISAFYPIKNKSGDIVPNRPMSPDARLNFGHQSSNESIPMADIHNFLGQLRAHCESRWRTNVTELEQRLRNFSDEDRRMASAHFEGRERQLEAYAGSLVQEIQIENSQHIAHLEFECSEMQAQGFNLENEVHRNREMNHNLW